MEANATLVTGAAVALFAATSLAGGLTYGLILVPLG